jgi:hypothetical protein
MEVIVVHKLGGDWLLSHLETSRAGLIAGVD